MVMILDGGMGQELVARAGKATGLWSVQALLDRPELVRAVHDDFFAAGAEIATTNGYSVLPDRLEAHGIAERFEELTELSCQLACNARDAHGSGLVAGCMGPIGFSYQPDKAPPADQAAEVYARIAQLQLHYVDLHIMETMSSVDQARGALMGASVTGKPVWLAVSVEDRNGERLRSGEPVAALKPLIDEFQPEALLINCSRPEAVTQAVPIIAGWGPLTGAYANGFVSIEAAFDHIGATVDLLTSREDLGPRVYAEFAAQWAKDGASLIGGCCEVGPAHIKELVRRLK
ncbi:MAG: homocysteine S-methyltransferase family protein [Pseudomonadota bacterium]